MSRDWFATRVEHARQRADLLRASSHGDASTGSWETAALEELATCLEELKVAEEELRSQADELAELNRMLDRERVRYRELFTSAPHGYVVTDLDGTITEANAVAGELFGLSPHGLRGKPLPLFVSLHDRDRFHRWLRALGRSDDSAPPPADEGVFTLHSFDRRRGFPCRMVPRAMPPDGEAGAELRWAVQDVTDRERARAADRLQEEGRRKDEFLAVLGHELRNPLAAISLAADILTGQEVAIDQERAAEVVRRNAAQLRHLVDDLLDISRVAHGRVTLRCSAVDLREVLQIAIESARPFVAARGHQLAITGAEEPVWVQGDAARLQQIVANLLDNAAKYTPAGGRVSLDLRVDGGAAVLTVADNGIGIPAHMQERIFELFEQIEGSSERSERGLGLGLALVRDLVRLHGGTVRTHSDGPGHGSAFVVQLPLTSASAEPAATSQEPALAAPAPAEPVLVVDDNIDAADLLAMTLRARGHEVLVAHDGPEALAAVGHDRPVGVALVDLGLPGMDGFELAGRLRQSLPGVVLVAVTGYGDEDSRAMADQAGFDRYLLKPVRPADVFAILDALRRDPGAGSAAS